MKQFILAFVALFFTGFISSSSIAQNIEREIIVLYENDTTNNTIQIDLVYNNGHIQVVLDGDTLSFCDNDEKMFRQMPDFWAPYLETYRHSFINSPTTWVLIVDRPPYGSFYRTNHNEIFEDQIKNCSNGVVYHLRNTNSHLNFKCKDH